MVEGAQIYGDRVNVDGAKAPPLFSDARQVINGCGSSTWLARRCRVDSGRHPAQIPEHTPAIALGCVAVERENYHGCAFRTRTQSLGPLRTLNKAHAFRAERISVQTGAALDDELVAAKGRFRAREFDSGRTFQDLG